MHESHREFTIICPVNELLCDFVYRKSEDIAALKGSNRLRGDPDPRPLPMKLTIDGKNGTLDNIGVLIHIKMYITDLVIKNAPLLSKFSVLYHLPNLQNVQFENCFQYSLSEDLYNELITVLQWIGVSHDTSQHYFELLKRNPFFKPQIVLSGLMTIVEKLVPGETLCPITYTPLSEIKDAIIFVDRIYEREAFYSCIMSQGVRHPFTREYWADGELLVSGVKALMIIQCYLNPMAGFDIGWINEIRSQQMLNSDETRVTDAASTRDNNLNQESAHHMITGAIYTIGSSDAALNIQNIQNEMHGAVGGTEGAISDTGQSGTTHQSALNIQNIQNETRGAVGSGERPNPYAGLSLFVGYGTGCTQHHK